MERNTALEKLKELIGRDLIPLSRQYGVTVFKGGKPNKGWAGHVLERYLGLPLNSAQAPNFGSWELKVVPLKRKAHSGELVTKETMAITMIDPINVLAKSFEESHLLMKLKRAVVCARLFESKEEKRSILMKVTTFDLDDQALFRKIKDDYELVRSCIKCRGFDCLTGKMGTYVQPRTKGPGHGSKSRAFYARKNLVSLILKI